MRPQPLRVAAAALAAAFVVATTACAEPLASERPPTVILISLDGVRHDFLDRGPFPALDRIAREGVRAERLTPVFPSSTFPGHVSLATGATPDVHGIVDNEFWDRAREERFDYDNDASWIEAEPLWAAAERQGVPAATYFWVGSETDWRGVGARHRIAPFDSGVGEAEKVAQILAWLDLPESERPRLVMSWWHGADRAGHRYGPDHPEVAAALAAQDHHLGILLAGLDARDAWSHTTLVLVSDHGMTTADHTIPLKQALSEAGVDARVETGSAVTHLFFSDEADRDRAAAALEPLDGVRVDRREDVPASAGLAHPERSGDLIVRALPGYTFRRGGLLARVGDLLGQRRGFHGYAPDHPDMAGIFVAMGRGIDTGARIGPIAMIDVAPTVAALLGIDPPQHATGTAASAIVAVSR